VESVSGDGNFIRGVHYLAADSTVGPVHVSRVVRFASVVPDIRELVSFQLDAGSYVVDDVLEHRQLEDGSYEFHIRWLGAPVTTWAASKEVKKVVKVKEYCVRVGLPPPGTEPRRAAVASGVAVAEGVGVRRGRARRGRGRGGKR
jgi:hypothetical protein